MERKQPLNMYTLKIALSRLPSVGKSLKLAFNERLSTKQECSSRKKEISEKWVGNRHWNRKSGLRPINVQTFVWSVFFY